MRVCLTLWPVAATCLSMSAYCSPPPQIQMSACCAANTMPVSSSSHTHWLLAPPPPTHTHTYRFMSSTTRFQMPIWTTLSILLVLRPGSFEPQDFDIHPWSFIILAHPVTENGKLKTNLLSVLSHFPPILHWVNRIFEGTSQQISSFYGALINWTSLKWYLQVSRGL